MADSKPGETPASDVPETSGFLREPSLRRRPFGYSVKDTDALLERAAATVDRLRKTLTKLREETARDAAAPAEATESGPLPPAAVALVGDVLVSAHQAVALLKEKAQHEARKVIEEAEDAAAAIVNEASEERRRQEQEQQEAERVLEHARAEAQRIVDQATHDRELILVESERLRTAADEMRRQWLEQMSQLLGQLSHTLAPGPEADAAEIHRELIARVQDPGAPANTDEPADT